MQPTLCAKEEAPSSVAAAAIPGQGVAIFLQQVYWNTIDMPENSVLKCEIQRILVYSQSCTTITVIWFQNIFITTATPQTPGSLAALPSLSLHFFQSPAIANHPSPTAGLPSVDIS